MDRNDYNWPKGKMTRLLITEFGSSAFRHILLKNSNSEQCRFSAEFRLPGKSNAIYVRDCTKGSVTNFQPGLIPPRIQEILSGLRANDFSLISETEFFNTIRQKAAIRSFSKFLENYSAMNKYQVPVYRRGVKCCAGGYGGAPERF